MHIYWQRLFSMTSSPRGKCDWPATQSGLHPATLDVNKICSCIFFLAAQLAEDAETQRNQQCFIAWYTHVLEGGKKKKRLLCAQMESSEVTLCVKCSAGEHLGFFWPETSSIIYKCPFLTALWWKWRCGSSLVAGEQWPNAWRSTSRHITFLGCNFLLFIFPNMFNARQKMRAQTKKCYISPPSAPCVSRFIGLLDEDRFFFPHSDSQTLMERNPHLFSCFKLTALSLSFECIT